MTLALSALCENPGRRTGLSTLLPAFVASARVRYPDVQWIVFSGPGLPWPRDPAVRMVEGLPANDRPLARLVSDHARVAALARQGGASALLTVGFHPLRDAGLPIVMQVFAVDTQATGLRGAYRRWALLRGLARSRLVITNSAWARDQIGPASSRVLVSPEGLDHARFRPEGDRGYPGVEPGYVLWSSNLYPYKRFALALAAYAGLPEPLRRSTPFVVVGGEWDGGAARDAARRLSGAGRVDFLGWVPDEALPGLYRGARAQVLSTAFETFGRSVTEAMACGCPSLVQDLPVLREVAADGAAFVDFADTAAASRALERLLTDTAAHEGLVRSGIARAEGFSFERLVRERMEAILSAIAEVRP